MPLKRARTIVMARSGQYLVVAEIDVGKRPLMGRVASEWSDHVVLTSDNPRSESPQKIVDEIRSGMTKAPVLEELDRAQAIRFVVENAATDDWVLLAGKGHENTQTIGQSTAVYSDRAEVARLFGLMNSEVQHASSALSDLASVVGGTMRGIR